MSSTGPSKNDESGHVRRFLRSTLAGAQDHPECVTLALAVVVALHAVASTCWWPPLNPFKVFGDPTQLSTVVTIYLGAAGASALVAGFAGVVLVFTIGAQTPRVRMFRDQGGRSLQRNWLVVVAEPFIAMMCALIAAVTQLTAGRGVAPWLLECALVILGHGALRLLMLLRDLVQIVAADDELIGREERTIPLSHFDSALMEP